MEYRIIATSVPNSTDLKKVILDWYRQSSNPVSRLPSSTSSRPLVTVDSAPKKKTDTRPSYTSGTTVESRITRQSGTKSHTIDPLSKRTATGINQPLSQTQTQYEIGHGIRIKQISSFGGSTQDFFWQGNDLFIIDRHNGHSVWKRGVGATLLSSRRGALIGTENFAPGTVGYNVHESISSIRLLMGSLGEAKIGELFNRSDVQKILALESTPENNRKVATMEWQYWNNVLHHPSQSAEGFWGSADNLVGGLLGSAFGPSVRVSIQQGMGWERENRENFVSRVYEPSLLAIRDEVDALKTFARRRMNDLSKLTD